MIMTGKCIAYYRVSTGKQGNSGLGLEAQRKAVNDYLNGGSWTLVAELTERWSGIHLLRHAPSKQAHNSHPGGCGRG